MRRIVSKLDTASATYKSNYANSLRLVEELRRKQDAARFERPQRDLDRLARQGKLFIRERLEALLDPGTPFLELSTLAANEAYDGEAPGAGQVTGIGVVSGREVVVHADDGSVK